MRVPYCNRECQVAHWKQHRKVCGGIGVDGRMITSDQSISTPLEKLPFQLSTRDAMIAQHPPSLTVNSIFSDCAMGIGGRHTMRQFSWFSDKVRTMLGELYHEMVSYTEMGVKSAVILGTGREGFVNPIKSGYKFLSGATLRDFTWKDSIVMATVKTKRNVTVRVLCVVTNGPYKHIETIREGDEGVGFVFRVADGKPDGSKGAGLVLAVVDDRCVVCNSIGAPDVKRKKIRMFRCSKCARCPWMEPVFYCGRACQARDASRHRCYLTKEERKCKKEEAKVAMGASGLEEEDVE